MMRTNFENIEIITNQLIIIVSWVVILLVLLGLSYIFWDDIWKKGETTNNDVEFNYFNEMIISFCRIVFLGIPIVGVSLNILVETFLLFVNLYETSFIFN